MSESKFCTGEWVVNRGDVIGRFRYDSVTGKAFYTPTTAYSFMMGAEGYGREVELKGTRAEGFSVSGEYVGSKQSGKLTATLTSEGRLKLVLLYPDARFKKEVEYDCEATPGSLRPNASKAGRSFLVAIASGDVGVGPLGSLTTATVKVRDIGAAWETWYWLVAAGVGGSMGLSVPSQSSWRRLDLGTPVVDWSGTTVDFCAAGASLLIVGINKLRVKLRFAGAGTQMLDFSDSGFSLGLEVKTGVVSVGVLKKLKEMPFIEGA